MRVFRTIDIAGSSLTAHRLWMDVIASNLANVNTTRTETGGSYARKTPVFAEILATEEKRQCGGGVRVVDIAEDTQPPRLVYQPDHPDADERGYVAYPNVNVVREMADMMTASRSYEANLAVADGVKNMWNGALDILRG
ncbi:MULTISPECIES: flagellar basal body rod protein FlgC [Aminobacterium]|uniref:flagellar basal body rod protein FlgC n=1 Tax=Aminobacterium TaxID=81466 RepID=UPI00257E5CDE|nr:MULTISPECIES: flagellar basal body rod protein FlgC [unclassified Aminobacterium]